MIINDIKVFSQNVWKNNLIMNTILEANINFDIIFIQEPSWSTICSIPSPKNGEGESLASMVNHPNWLTFVRTSELENDFSRVVIYVNIRLVIYQSQLGGLKYKSMFNTGIALTHFICMGCVKNLLTSILAFDIAQYFLSLNHCLLTRIWEKWVLICESSIFFLTIL